MRVWQSNLSRKPPWPGIVSAKSLIFRPLFNPEAKNPPNGAIRLAMKLRIIQWMMNSEQVTEPMTGLSKGMVIFLSVKVCIISHLIGWNGVITSWSWGHSMNCSSCESLSRLDTQKAIRIAKTKVLSHPPMKPSQVFLGDNAIKGVFPKSLPKT